MDSIHRLTVQIMYLFGDTRCPGGSEVGAVQAWIPHIEERLLSNPLLINLFRIDPNAYRPQLTQQLIEIKRTESTPNAHTARTATKMQNVSSLDVVNVQTFGTSS